MPAKSKNISAHYFIHSGTYPPPKALPRPAAALWRRIMKTTPAGQWHDGDLPLLSMYCRVAALADQAVGNLERSGQLDEFGKPSVWVKIVFDHAKTMSQLSAKLRLAPSSRIRAETHLLRQLPAGPPPWARMDDDDLLLAKPA